MTQKTTEKYRSVFTDANNLCLLLVSVGPVQDFISEARKARDLWTGSYILSYITFKAMEPILQKYKSEDVIIYPQIEESPFYKLYKGGSVSPVDLQFPSLPNHFLAVIDTSSIKTLTDEICTYVKTYWDRLAQKTHDLIGGIVNGKYKNWDNLWNYQIDDHFQVYWVALPITMDELESKDHYIKNHDEIQRLMESRKLTRTFIQWHGSNAFKCYQCGHREIIGTKDFWKYLSGVKKLHFKIKENEKLCAVCLVKRFASEDDILKGLQRPAFESTSDISSRPFKDFISTKESEEKVKAFLDFTNGLCSTLGISKLKSIKDIPGDWLYKEGLRLKALKKEFPSADDNQFKTASGDVIKALGELTKEYKTSPSKYYAILMLDGDKMGEKVSRLGIDEQRELSKKIGELGNKTIPEIIYKSKGYPLYSGGDDLLAFLPLEKSVSTAFELRRAFSNCLDSVFTCSASLVIVHHQDSLRRALEEVRNGMLMAKDSYNRDAFVITLMFSSGTLITGGSKWYLPDSPPFAEFLTTLVRMMTLEEGTLGNQFIYDILKKLPAFYDEKKRLSRNMLESEVRRLLDRHIPEKSILRKNGSIDCAIQSILSLGGIRGLQIDVEDNLAAILRLSAFYARENLREL